MATAREDRPEPDRAGDAPHPRFAAQVFGQDTAQAGFLDAFNAGRLHHGWLISGPEGIGKATLAWRIARFLLTMPDAAPAGLFAAPPPATLTTDPGHPVAHRLRALSDPGLFLLRRPFDDKTDRLKTQITVEEVRRLHNFFHLSAADGGRRVVIVDAMDEMNTQGANALLKMLEEPPARTTLLLIAHQPGRLLPTIRSRCRELRLSPLGPVAMAAALEQAGVGTPDAPAALAELAGGSVGEALRLIAEDGLTMYARLAALADALPRLDRPAMLALADLTAGRNDARADLMFQLLDRLITRLARAGATGQPPQVELVPGEAQMLARLAPDPARARAWASAAQVIGARVSHGRAVNIDAPNLMLDALLRVQETAQG
jgi:DNA polymerase-3 subunit delta'